MPLINCKIHLELSWTKDCVMSNIDPVDPPVDNPPNVTAASFLITDTKLYVSIVTLSTKDNVNLTKQLNEGFKRSVYWNEYISNLKTESPDDNNNVIKFPLDASF